MSGCFRRKLRAWGHDACLSASTGDAGAKLDPRSDNDGWRQVLPSDDPTTFDECEALLLCAKDLYRKRLFNRKCANAAAS